VHASGHSCRTVCTPSDHLCTLCLCVCVCFTGRRRVSACIRAQLQNCVYAFRPPLYPLFVCVCVLYREKESECMHQGIAAELCVRLRPPLYPLCVCVCVCVCFTGRRRVSACIRAQLQNSLLASDHLFL